MRLPKFLFCICFSLLGSNAIAALSEQTIDKLIVVSGLEVQVNQLPEVIKSAGTQAAGQNLQSGQQVDFERILGELVSTDGIFQKIRSGLNANFNEAEAQVIFNWLESSLGKRITRAEEESSTPQAMADMQRRAASLMLSEQRLAYATQIIQLTQGEDLMLDIQDKMMIRVFEAVSRVMRPDEGPRSLT